MIKLKLYAILFLISLLLILSTSNSFKVEDKPLCMCLDYFQSISDSTGELIEFKTAIKGDEIAKSLNNFYQGNEIRNKFKLNINDENQFTRSPQIGFAKAKDTTLICKTLKLHFNKNTTDNQDKLQFLWSYKHLKFKEDSNDYYSLYAFKESGYSGITKSHIQEARVSTSPYDNKIGVSINMTRDGVEKWRDFTAKNIGNFVAIISQNKVLSAPIINGTIRGGETIIAGDFTEKEAENIVTMFNCDSYSSRIGWDEFEKEMKRCE